jgi:hypothetical protein
LQRNLSRTGSFSESFDAQTPHVLGIELSPGLPANRLRGERERFHRRETIINAKIIVSHRIHRERKRTTGQVGSLVPLGDSLGYGRELVTASDLETRETIFGVPKIVGKALQFQQHIAFDNAALQKAELPGILDA